jgi:hypothetical protein
MAETQRTRKIYFPPSFRCPMFNPAAGPYLNKWCFVAYGNDTDKDDRPVLIDTAYLTDYKQNAISGEPIILTNSNPSGDWSVLFACDKDPGVTSLYIFHIVDANSKVYCTTPFKFIKPPPVLDPKKPLLTISSPTNNQIVPSTFPCFGADPNGNNVPITGTLMSTQEGGQTYIQTLAPGQNYLWFLQFTSVTPDTYTLTVTDGNPDNQASTDVTVLADDPLGDETEGDNT